MKLPQLHLRDLFWLVLVVACLCAWWMERQRVHRLSMELKYVKSVVPPVAFIETPLNEAIGFLSAKHNIPVEVDWESLKAKGITERMLVTHNLVDGSFPWAIKRLFLGYEGIQVVATTGGLLITAENTSEEAVAPD